MLDHILLGCNNLQHGIDFVEQHTGVRAAFGGVHPGRGTQNALLSLGTRRYLEILAPDPQQHADDPIATKLKGISEPRLVRWAANTGNMAALVARLKAAAIAFEGPNPGSRKRPDGKTLNWQTLNLTDDLSGLLPFFIQWSEYSVHPSVDAPSGCTLASFELISTDPNTLSRISAHLSLDVPISEGPAAQLRAVIASPSHLPLELTT